MITIIDADRCLFFKTRTDDTTILFISQSSLCKAVWDNLITYLSCFNQSDLNVSYLPFDVYLHLYVYQLNKNDTR